MDRLYSDGHSLISMQLTVKRTTVSKNPEPSNANIKPKWLESKKADFVSTINMQTINEINQMLQYCNQQDYKSCFDSAENKISNLF